jgi:hypothetical protein
MIKHYWLVAGNVIANNPQGQVGQKGLNTLVRTDKPFFTRRDLATAHDGLMQRFIKETPQEKGSKIVDVFVLSVSNLGVMPEEEFEREFSDVSPDPVRESLRGPLRVEDH